MLLGQAILTFVVFAAVALLAFDLWQSRRDDRFAAEEQEPGASVIQHGMKRAFGKGAPALARVVSPLAIGYGILSFPATLAPVILAVLAMQAQPLGGDGTTALVSMIVAGGLLLSDDDAARVVVARSIFYMVGWAALVLTLLTFARRPTGLVATIVYAHVGLTVLVAILLRVAQWRAVPRNAIP